MLMIKASKIIKNSKGHHEKLLGLPTVAIQLSFGGDQDNLHLKNHHYLFLAKKSSEGECNKAKAAVAKSILVSTL